MNMLAAGIKRAGTLNVDKVALALEGMEWTTRAATGSSCGVMTTSS